MDAETSNQAWRGAKGRQIGGALVLVAIVGLGALGVRAALTPVGGEAPLPELPVTKAPVPIPTSVVAPKPTQATLAGQIVVNPMVVANAQPTSDATTAPQLSVTPQPAAVQQAPAQPAATPYIIRHVLPVDGPMRHGDWYWNEAGAPAGPVIVTVDLKAQVLSIFRGGYEIGTAVILYGADAKPTPLGVYPITQKDAHHVSNIYQGAPMPYMLRLTDDGISIHASDIKDGYMTHGCIGVPIAFARKLFDAVKVGDRVIVTRGETLQQGEAVKAAS